MVEQGIISHFFDPLCFPEWYPSTNPVTYRLYRPFDQEHITPIERIPDLAARRRWLCLSSLGSMARPRSSLPELDLARFGVTSTHVFRRESPPRSAWKSWFAAPRSPSSSAGRHSERTLGRTGRVSRSPSSATTRPVSRGRSTGATAISAGIDTIGSPPRPTSTHCLPRSTQIRRPSSGVDGSTRSSMPNLDSHP